MWLPSASLTLLVRALRPLAASASRLTSLRCALQRVATRFSCVVLRMLVRRSGTLVSVHTSTRNHSCAPRVPSSRRLVVAESRVPSTSKMAFSSAVSISLPYGMKQGRRTRRWAYLSYLYGYIAVGPSAALQAGSSKNGQYSINRCVFMSSFLTTTILCAASACLLKMGVSY